MVGAITDALGSLSYALNVSAAMLAVGAIAAAFQRKLRHGAASTISEWRIAVRKLEVFFLIRHSLFAIRSHFNSR